MVDIIEVQESTEKAQTEEFPERKNREDLMQDLESFQNNEKISIRRLQSEEEHENINIVVPYVQEEKITLRGTKISHGNQNTLKSSQSVD